MKTSKTKRWGTVSLGLLLGVLLAGSTLFDARRAGAEGWLPLIFPVIGPATFVNDYYVSRPAPWFIHGATDIMAGKGQALVSPVNGIITQVVYPQAPFGYMISIRDYNGYTYSFIHMNDDHPGTNDGTGGGMHAYAPDMLEGNPVVAGQLIGWVGDSGYSGGVPHLHFEMEKPDGSRMNPYESLLHAHHLPEPIGWYPQLPNEVLPYNVFFKGSINIDMGNFDADPESETVTGAGAPGGPHVRIVGHDNVMVPGAEFFAYDRGFAGGVDVAAGDVDGDGIDEIITAAGPGGGPHIRIFKVNGTEVGGFYAYAPGFIGGVRVAAADIDGDGNAEIITGAGAGGSPQVRVFKADGTPLNSFYAYSQGFTGGIDVAAGDLDNDGLAEIATAPQAGGGPHVKVFDNTGAEVIGFGAYDGNYTGGVRVSIGNVDTGTDEEELLTAPAAFGGPHVRMFDGTGQVLAERMFMEMWWGGFYDIAAGTDNSKASAGLNRRGTVRNAGL